ncbi:MAG: flavodoxin family protein [Syntrophomonadaceae bacterium]|jgi:multimeric flavodoxin WrbA|nr:flavodoxin family protein [Syntrophomonadaceae bacterium]
MQIVCISSSNIKHAGQNSTSLKACKLICEIFVEKTCCDVKTEIITLADYEPKPCIGCGACFYKDKCVHDNEFNRIYSILCKADALFVISAHYAPIPSKLAMLLEKVEQIAFLKRFNDESYRSPLFGKPVGIIAHGGGTEEIHKYYIEPVINTIWNALSYPVEMNIIGVNEEQPRGVTFPVKAVKKVDGYIFPKQEYDWNDIEMRLEPLVNKVIAALQDK